MKKSQKLLSLILSILILFCGCSAQKEVTSLELSGRPAAPQESLDLNTAPSAPTVEIDTTQKKIDNKTFYLERQRLSLPKPLLSVTAQTILDDTILIGGFSTNGVALTWMTLDGDSGTLQLPDGTEYLYALSPDDNGGFWLLCGSIPAAYRDAFGNVVIQDNEPEGKLVLTHYDSEYSMQETILLQTRYTGNNERFTQLAKTEKGFILLSAELLVQLDKLGAETARQNAEFEDGWRFISMQKIGNKLFVLTQNRYDAAGAELRLFSADTFVQQEFTTDRTGITGLGLCADGRLLLGDNQTVSALTPETAEEETILVWQELGVADTSEQIWQTDSGFFFYTPNLTELTVLRWMPGVALSKRILSLAIAGNTPVSGYFVQMIQNFNLSQEQYQIEYIIYSDTGLTDTQPTDLLRTQIMAGQSPDLYAFCTDGFTAAPLTPEAVCADLLPLLENDLSEKSFVPGLYELLTESGSLYQLPLSIEVDTMIVPARLIPEPGVTLEELEQAREQMPDSWVTIDSWNTPGNLFAAFCTAFCLGKYVDRATGSCNFETQSFYDYLAWCKEWGGDGSTPPAQEQTLVHLCQISALSWLANRSEIVQNTWYGEPGYTYAGFPTDDGNIGNAYRILTSLGVSPQCRDLSGARAFLQYCFSYLQEESLPANYELLQSEMKEYIDGNRTDWRGEIKQVSEADAEQFYTLLDSIAILEGLDAPLSEILSEEADVYFAGGCTAEQAAKNIQSRASLYLQEQYF